MRDQEQIMVNKQGQIIEVLSTYLQLIFIRREKADVAQEAMIGGVLPNLHTSKYNPNPGHSSNLKNVRDARYLY